MTLASQTRLGRYTVLHEIASGGMGVVYLARSEGELGFKRTVALKVIHPHLLGAEGVVARFVDEARVSSSIAHPNVVPVLDVCRVDGLVFLVMDYVHGDSLSSLLRVAKARGEQVDISIAAAIMHDALEGLDAVHEAVGERGAPLNVVHRDVSPHNVLVSDRGVAHIADFGVAKVRDALPLTKSGEIVGKPGYLAPEQLQGKPVTRATDVYAAGLVLWEALVGTKMFTGLRAQHEAFMHDLPPTRPSTLRPEVPKALDDLIVAMLARAPSDRPRTAAEAARLLEDAVPLARRADVARWVKVHAAERLSQVESLISENVPRAVVRGSDATDSAYASTVREPFHRPGTASTLGAGTPSPVTRTARDVLRRAPPLAMGIVVGGLLALAALSLGILRRPPATSAPGVAVVSLDAVDAGSQDGAPAR